LYIIARATMRIYLSVLAYSSWPTKHKDLYRITAKG
jgi:hypothetical protein